MKFLPLQSEVEKKSTRHVYFFGGLSEDSHDARKTPAGSDRERENQDIANHIRFDMPRSFAGRILNVLRGKPNPKGIRARDSLRQSQSQYQQQFSHIKQEGQNAHAAPESAQKAAQQELAAFVGNRAYRQQNEEKDWSGKMARPNSPLTNPSTLKLMHPGLWSGAIGLDRIPPANSLFYIPGVTTSIPWLLAAVTNGSNRGLDHHFNTSKEHLLKALDTSKNPYSKIASALTKNSFNDTVQAFQRIIGTVPGLSGPDKFIKTSSLAVLDLQESVVNQILSMNIDDLFEMEATGQEQYESIHWSARGFRQFTHGWSVQMAQASLRNMIAKSKDRIAELRRILTVRNRNLNANVQGALIEAQMQGDYKTQDEIQAQIRFALENPDQFIKSGAKVRGKNKLETLMGDSDRTVVLDVLNSYYTQSIIGLGYADVDNVNAEDYWNHAENRYQQLEVEGEDSWPSFSDIQAELQHPDNNIEQNEAPQNIASVVAEVTRGISDAFGVNIFEIYKADPNTTSVFPLLSMEEQFIYLMKFLNGKLEHHDAKQDPQTLIRKLDPEAQSVLLRYLNDTANALEEQHISGAAVNEPQSIELRADVGSRAQNVISTGKVITDPDFPEQLMVAARDHDGRPFQTETQKITDFITSFNSFEAYFGENQDNLFKADRDAFNGVLTRARDFKSYLETYLAKLTEERQTYKKSLDNLGAHTVPHPDYPDDRSMDITGNDETSGEEIALEIKIKGYRVALQEMDTSTMTAANTDVADVDTTKANALKEIITAHDTKLAEMRTAKVEARGLPFTPLALQDFGNSFRMMGQTHANYMTQSGIKARVDQMLTQASESAESTVNNFDHRFKRQLKKDIHAHMQGETLAEIEMASASTYNALTRIERPEGLHIDDITLVITDLTQGNIRIPTAFNSQETWTNVRIRFSGGGTVMMEGEQDGESFVLVMDRPVALDPNQEKANYSNVKVYKKDDLDPNIFQQPNPHTLLPTQYEKSGAAINIHTESSPQREKMRSKFSK